MGRGPRELYTLLRIFVALCICCYLFTDIYEYLFYLRMFIEVFVLICFVSLYLYLFADVFLSI